MSCELSLRTKRAGATRVVVLDGELDMITSPELARVVAELSATDDLVIDLGLVPTIDSSGFTALVDAHHRLAGRGRRLTIRGVRAGPMRLMRALGLDTRLHLDGRGQETAEEAARRIAALRRLYRDLAGDPPDLRRCRELWAQVDVEQQALAKLVPGPSPRRERSSSSQR